jgi:hypothetical protein
VCACALAGRGVGWLGQSLERKPERRRTGERKRGGLEGGGTPGVGKLWGYDRSTVSGALKARRPAGRSDSRTAAGVEVAVRGPGGGLHGLDSRKAGATPGYPNNRRVRVVDRGLAEELR